MKINTCPRERERITQLLKSTSKILFDRLLSLPSNAQKSNPKHAFDDGDVFALGICFDMSSFDDMRQTNQMTYFPRFAQNPKIMRLIFLM